METFQFHELTLTFRNLGFLYRILHLRPLGFGFDDVPSLKKRFQAARQFLFTRVVFLVISLILGFPNRLRRTTFNLSTGRFFILFWYSSILEKVSHPSGNPQLGRKAKVGPIYYPNSLPGPTVDELLQRLNGNAPPTKTIGRKAPGTNGFVLARDAVPWKSSAQREAERVETMRQQAEEEKGKRKSLSSQLPPSFATSLHDVDKENAEGRRDVCVGKKCENVAKNALGAP